MIETSTGMMTQARLKDGSRPFHVGAARWRVGGLRQIEIVLRQRNQQVGIIVQPCTFDGLPGAKHPRRILSQRVNLALVEGVFFVGHNEILPHGRESAKSSAESDPRGAALVLCGYLGDDGVGFLEAMHPRL